MQRTYLIFIRFELPCIRYHHMSPYTQYFLLYILLDIYIIQYLSCNNSYVTCGLCNY
jgi:hypothetical protein